MKSDDISQYLTIYDDDDGNVHTWNQKIVAQKIFSNILIYCLVENEL